MWIVRLVVGDYAGPDLLGIEWMRGRWCLGEGIESLAWRDVHFADQQSLVTSSLVVNLAIFSQICVDLSKANWVACIEELGQRAVRALVFSLGCRGRNQQ